MVSTRVLTQIYLEPRQKTALQTKAHARGTKLAEEVRNAVDAYLAGITSEEFELLDAATREAETHLKAMAAELDRVNAKLDRAFSELESIRAKSQVARYRETR